MLVFESVSPGDRRPRTAILEGRKWANTLEFKMSVIRGASLAAHDAAREVKTLRSDNPEAYVSYVEGANLANRFDHVPELGLFTSAEAILKKCLELDPKYAPAYAELSYLYHNYRAYRATSEEERKRYFDLGNEFCRKATELGPGRAEVLFAAIVHHHMQAAGKVILEVLGLTAACLGQRLDTGGPLPARLKRGPPKGHLVDRYDFYPALVEGTDVVRAREALLLHFLCSCYHNILHQPTLI